MGFKIRPQDRLSIIGRTGSGKTWWTLALLRYWIWFTRDWNPYHIIILDTKKDGDFDGLGKKFHRLKDLSKLWDKYRILIYEPIEEEMEDEFYNGFFRFIRQSGEPILLLIDELASVAHGISIVREYELLMKQGRGKFQAVWAGIQNPIRVPHDFLSNSDHYFVFDLLVESDRDKVASIIGGDVKTPPPMRPGDGTEHGFYYFLAKKRETMFYPNEPAIVFPVPTDFDPKTAIRMMDEQKEGKPPMNWRLLWALALLALAMVLLTPLWRIFFRWLAHTLPATKRVNDYVELA